MTDQRPLSQTEAELIDAYWRAANYVAVEQIYLLDNPLLREPLRPEHTKPRLLGHWGTTPGLNFVYAHMNRVIRNWGLDAIYALGPGHGGTCRNHWLLSTSSVVSCPRLPQWPASTPLSMPPCRRLRRPTPFPRSGGDAGRCAGSASMGSRTPGPHVVRRS